MIIALKYRLLEALGGFEPPNQSFADSCLTTWLQRRFLLFTLLPYTVAVTRSARTPTATWLQRSIKNLERETGLKPATSTLARQRSINWAIPAFPYKIYSHLVQLIPKCTYNNNKFIPHCQGNYSNHLKIHIFIIKTIL